MLAQAFSIQDLLMSPDDLSQSQASVHASWSRIVAYHRIAAKHVMRGNGYTDCGPQSF